MYSPFKQPTSGPASPAWSPDGTELVYAMQGSLWRQRVGSDEARQITDGPGYDHDYFNGNLKALKRFAGYKV